MTTPSPSLTRRESELAHHLALAWAMWLQDVPKDLDHRSRAVVDEANRVLPGYVRMSEEELAQHLQGYSIPPEFSGPAHSAWCETGQGPCTCREPERVLRWSRP